MTTVNPHGLHHVTAIASSPQRNVDFYTRALGLRLVKQTVNFDAPESYHLYYGDEQGSPSSLLTFFPWPGVSQGRHGAGMSTATAFSVPGDSLGWWHQRFQALAVDVDPPRTRDAEEVLSFRDPDGMIIDLVASAGDHRSGWDGVADIPAEHAVRARSRRLGRHADRAARDERRCRAGRSSPVRDGWRHLRGAGRRSGRRT